MIRVLEVAIEKIEDRFVGTNLIRLLREPVPLVIEQHILDNTIALLDVLDDLIRLGLDNARVVRTLQHDQRLHNLVGMKQRRDCLQILQISTWIANLLIE